MPGQRQINLELLHSLFGDEKVAVVAQIDPEPAQKNGQVRQNSVELYQAIERGAFKIVNIAGSRVQDPHSFVKVLEDCSPHISKNKMVAPSQPAQMVPAIYDSIFPKLAKNLFIYTVWNSSHRDYLSGLHLKWDAIWRKERNTSAPWENSIKTPYVVYNNQADVGKLLDTHPEIVGGNLRIPDPYETADLARAAASELGVFYLEGSGATVPLPHIQNAAQKIFDKGYNDAWLIIGGGMGDQTVALERLRPCVGKVNVAIVLGDSLYSETPPTTALGVADAIKSYSPK